MAIHPATPPFFSDMSSLYRRKPRRRTSGGHLLPISAILLILIAAACVCYYLYRNKIKTLIEGKPPVIQYTNEQANAHLESLLRKLSGNKADLLDLHDNWRAELGWIKDEATHDRFLWILLTRLIEKDEWDRALKVLPQVEHLATPEQLAHLAEVALQHNDLELQLRLDQRLQELAMQSSTKIQLLLHSIKRSAETAIRLQRDGEAITSLARLESPAVRARLTRPEDASLAAYLLMRQAEVSEVKEPILQKVRNILEAAKWPESPVTSELIVREVSNALRDNPTMDEQTMREVSAKLTKSRDAMLSEKSELRFLPECYSMLGELSFRLQEYDKAAEELALALAFAKGYNQLTPERLIEITRLQFRVNEERGDIREALNSCHYLLEHDLDPGQQMRYLLFLTKQSEEEEKIDIQLKIWKLLEDNPQLAEIHSNYRLEICRELSAYYEAAEQYAAATEWYEALMTLSKANPATLSAAKLYNMRINLALLQRKQNKDTTARNMLQKVVDDIKDLSDEERENLDRSDSAVYKKAVRELSRTYLLMGDSSTSRRLSRTIREGLPSKTR